jgi:hypothetical protein
MNQHLLHRFSKLEKPGRETDALSGRFVPDPVEDQGTKGSPG